MGLEPIIDFFYGFERDKMTRPILGGVDGVGKLLIVAAEKVGGDEGIHWVFYIYLFILGN